MYNFDDLVKILQMNKQVEFAYKNKEYSMTYGLNQKWFFTINDGMPYIFEICDIFNNEALIKWANEITLDDKSLKDIFNEKLYEEESLYIF